MRIALETLVVIGASAGGPAALAKVLASLPPDFPAPLVIIQHVDAQFAAGLAKWLDDQTPLQVCPACEGDHPEPGTALLAGRDGHLVLASPTRLAYTGTPMDCPYRPSIDVFFGSVDQWWRGNVVAALLTGMGRDGAAGLRLLHCHGHHTIVQDRSSSAVYGMPKAAVKLGAAREILPLDEIGPRLTHIVSQRMASHG
jgi:two-component system, chemotaxis family, response regulator WspF